MGLKGGLVAGVEFTGGMAIGCLETENVPGVVISVGSCALVVVFLVGVLAVDGDDAGLVVFIPVPVVLVAVAEGCVALSGLVATPVADCPLLPERMLAALG